MHHLTPIRQAVVDCLKIQHLMSAKDVVLALEKNENFANKTTIYRALDFLVAEGLVSKVQFLDTDAQYEVVTEDVHDHLVCTNCGIVEKTRPMSPPVKHVGPFEVKDRQTIYYGLCKKCTKDGRRTFGAIIGL